VARGEYRITAQHAAFAPGNCDVQVKSKAATTAATIKTVDGTILTGLVTLKNKPLPLAVVVLHSVSKTVRGKLDHIDLYLTVTSNQDGQFAFPRVAPGTYQLSAHEPGDPLARAMQQANSMRKIQLQLQANDQAQSEIIALR